MTVRGQTGAENDENNAKKPDSIDYSPWEFEKPQKQDLSKIACNLWQKMKICEVL